MNILLLIGGLILILLGANGLTDGAASELQTVKLTLIITKTVLFYMILRLFFKTTTVKMPNRAINSAQHYIPM